MCTIGSSNPEMRQKSSLAYRLYNKTCNSFSDVQLHYIFRIGCHDLILIVLRVVCDLLKKPLNMKHVLSLVFDFLDNSHKIHIDRRVDFLDN